MVGCFLGISSLQAADANPSGKITLTGTYIWSNQPGKAMNIKAELTPDGSQQWKAVYIFDHGEKTMTYTGRITGDLKKGPVQGTAVKETGKRSFCLESTVTNGVLNFNHFETTRGKVPTGTGALK